jgi:hypothetical protein
MAAMVHQGEMIVPASFAEGMRNGGGGMGGGTTVNLHVNAVDGQSVRRLFMDNGEHIAAALATQVRGMHPATRPQYGL